MEKLLPDPFRKSRSQIRKLRGRWGQNIGYRKRASLELHPAGKPQQNAYAERYNRTARHEWLDLYIFESIEELKQIATEWLWSYNHERPNMGNGAMTPAQKLKMAA